MFFFFFQIIQGHRDLFFTQHLHYHLDDVKFGFFVHFYVQRFRHCFSSVIKHYTCFERSPMTLGPTPLDPHRFFLWETH